MLFDLKGKRKRLIQVIYAILAVLMAGGLIFFGIGGETSGGLFDAFSDRTGASAGDQIDQAEEIEEQLATDPGNDQLLTRLIRARYTAGNSMFEVDDSGRQVMTAEAQEQFELAVDTWDRYLQQDPRRVDPNIAQLVANAYFSMAENATDGNIAQANAAAAAEAQRHYAEGRPSLGSLSSLALYSYFAGDFEEGDQAASMALEQSSDDTSLQQARTEMGSYRNQARRFQQELQEFNRAQQAQQAQEGSGAPQLQDPGLGGG